MEGHWKLGTLWCWADLFNDDVEHVFEPQVYTFVQKCSIKSLKISFLGILVQIHFYKMYCSQCIVDKQIY